MPAGCVRVRAPQAFLDDGVEGMGAEFERQMGHVPSSVSEDPMEKAFLRCERKAGA